MLSADEDHRAETQSNPLRSSGVTGVEVDNPGFAESTDTIQNPLFDHRRDIDGLRSVAVFGVVLFHMNPRYLPGGFTGVDIFFVISGFVVSSSLLRPRKQLTSIGGYFLAFYCRRIKRLTPALALVTFVSTLIVAATVPPYYDELDQYMQSAQLGLIGLVNNFYAADRGAGRAGANYFGVNDAKGLDWNPFTHYWSGHAKFPPLFGSRYGYPNGIAQTATVLCRSLSVEEQFYMCFPAMLLVGAGKRRTNVRAAKSFRNEFVIESRDGRQTPELNSTATVSTDTSSRRFLFLSVCCAVVSAVCCAVLTYSSTPRLAFYLLPARFWQLASGAVLFELLLGTTASGASSKFICHSHLAALLSWSSVVLFGVAFVFTPSQHDFPFPWSLPAISGTLCFIAAGSCGNSPPFNRLMAKGIFVYFGQLSYPIYLWHWPLLVCAGWIIDHEAVDVHIRTLGVSAAVVATALILAAATYHSVERWFRRWRPTRSWRVLAMLLPLIVSVELWIALLRKPLKGKLCVFNCVQCVLCDSCKNRRGNVSSTAGVRPLSTTWSTSTVKAVRDVVPAVSACTCTDLFQLDRAAETSYWPTVAVPKSTVPLGSGLGRPLCFDPAPFRGSKTLTWASKVVKPKTDLSTRCFDENAFQHYHELYGIDAGIQKGVHECLGRPQECGVDDRAKRVFLIGDSHAGNIWTGLRQAVLQSSTPTDVRFLGSACNTAIRVRVSPSWECEKLHDAVVAELTRQVRKGDAVVVTMLAVRAWRGALLDDNPASWRRALMNALPQLHNVTRARKATLVLFGDTPGLGQYWGLRPNRKRREVTYAESNISASFLREHMKFFAASHPTTEVIFSNALHDSFCQKPELHGGPKNSICSGHLKAGSKDVDLYWDTDHLTDHGSMYLWPWLCETLEGIGFITSTTVTPNKTK